MPLFLFLFFLISIVGNPIGDLAGVKDAPEPSSEKSSENRKENPNTSAYTESSGSTTRAYHVETIVDGDTIRVNIDGEIESIRLIGINAPEVKHPGEKGECFGPEATEELSELLLGKVVKLATDPTQDDRDVYGRLLRYVWEGDVFVNEWMIVNGNAREYTFIYPYRYQSAFQAAEVEARKEGSGLWAPGICE